MKLSGNLAALAEDKGGNRRDQIRTLPSTGKKETPVPQTQPVERDFHKMTVVLPAEEVDA